MPEVSVIVACTRPHLISGIARALDEQRSQTSCELVVAGDVDSIDSEGWGIPTGLISCEDTHPNRRRSLALARSNGRIVAFLDDDAIPEPGWLETAASLGPDALEIWTGPEMPTRSSSGARLAYAVSSSIVAEGTRAHVDWRHHATGWSAVPFCNLVTTRRLLDLIGPPSSAVPWDMDDFDLCLRAHLAGASFHNRPDLTIRHDRYPDRPAKWLRDKSRARFRTGEKLVAHPWVYARVPGVAIAGLAPPVAAIVFGVLSRSGRRTLGLAALLYITATAHATARRRTVGLESEPGAAGFAALLVALHVVSVTSLQAGLVRGLCRARRKDVELRRGRNPAGGLTARWYRRALLGARTPTGRHHLDDRAKGAAWPEHFSSTPRSFAPTDRTKEGSLSRSIPSSESPRSRGRS